MKVFKRWGMTIIISMIALTLWIIKDNNVQSSYSLNHLPGSPSEEELEGYLNGLSMDDLIVDFKEIERASTADSYEDLIPYATMMVKRESEASASKILEYLDGSYDYPILQTVLVQMYSDNGYDDSLIKGYLSDDRAADEVKYAIVAQAPFDRQELMTVYNETDSLETIASMKKLYATDRESAIELARNTILSESPSESKVLAATVCISDYYLENIQKNPQECALIIDTLWKFYDECTDEIVKNNIVYALARTNDFKTFADIIRDPGMNFYLKVSAVEFNKDKMVEMLAQDIQNEQLDVILEAMQIAPWKCVGIALNDSIKEGRIKTNEELTKIIHFIEEEGI